jgi:CDP-diacylglycerol--glycerol-3-phosphate 3-phosphatidyltransferase
MEVERPASAVRVFLSESSVSWTLLRVANGLSLARLLSAPLVVWAVLRTADTAENDWFAVGLVVALQATDVLDGILARRAKRGDPRRRLNPFGEAIDPVADKLYINCAYVTLTILGRVPLWAGGLIVARDVAILFGWVTKYLLTGVRLLPNAVGKAADATQALTLIVLLARPEPTVSTAFLWLVVALSIASGAAYAHMAWTARPAE